jgi:hypothetical protein
MHKKSRPDIGRLPCDLWVDKSINLLSPVLFQFTTCVTVAEAGL